MGGFCLRSEEQLRSLGRLIAVNVGRHSAPGKTVPWGQSPLLWMLAGSAWVFALFLAGHCTAYSQSSTYARLVGTVRDQSGAVIPGVDVIATAKATNASRVAVTDDRGEYIIDKLIPGRYDARAELPGFKTQVSSALRWPRWAG